MCATSERPLGRLLFEMQSILPWCLLDRLRLPSIDRMLLYTGAEEEVKKNVGERCCQAINKPLPFFLNSAQTAKRSRVSLP